MRHFPNDHFVADLASNVSDQYQLYMGNCLAELRNVADKSVDLILADMPYGTTECKWDQVIPFDQLWPELNRVKKPETAVLLFGTEPFSSLLRVSNIKNYRYDWVYEKPAATGFLNAKRQPLRAHELISVFYSKQPVYNPQKTQGHRRKQSEREDINSECYGKALKRTAYDSTERYPRSIQKFSSDKQKQSLHPTQKPVSLLEYMIRTYSHPGQTVLDFTMGSGSTGVACMNMGRRFIGIEMDADYFRVAESRLSACVGGGL